MRSAELVKREELMAADEAILRFQRTMEEAARAGVTRSVVARRRISATWALAPTSARPSEMTVSSPVATPVFVSPGLVDPAERARD